MEDPVEIYFAYLIGYDMFIVIKVEIAMLLNIPIRTISKLLLAMTIVTGDKDHL